MEMSIREMRTKLLITNLNEIFEDRLFKPSNGFRVGLLMYEFNKGNSVEYVIQGNVEPVDENDHSILFESSNNLIEVLLNGQN